MPSLEFLLASGIGMIAAAGIYLLLRARTFPVVLGLSLLAYAVNLFIFSSGGLWSGSPPVLTGAGTAADPLPQALVLTAIVIGFATTGFLVELALRSRHDSGSDHVDGAAGEAPGHHGARDDGTPLRTGPQAGPGAQEAPAAGTEARP